MDEERLRRLLELALQQGRKPDEEEPGFVDVLRGLEHSAAGIMRGGED